MLAMKIRTIRMVSDFLLHIERAKETEEKRGNKAGFIFRGQRTDEPLLPKLARIAPKGKLLKIEQLIVKEFDRISVSLTDIRPTSPWESLSLAQRHGLPTRLLDWTCSALAGLWFAIEKEPKKKQSQPESAVVWMLKTSVEDFIDESTRESPFSNGLTKIYRPKVIARRIAAQGGLFTVHKVQKGEHLVPLERNRRFSERLVKFLIPPDAFPNLRKHLNGCGINRFTLFPDLDGLCTHLTWRFTKLEDEL